MKTEWGLAIITEEIKGNAENTDGKRERKWEVGKNHRKRKTE
jgi:hypothetical protein